MSNRRPKLSRKLQILAMIALCTIFAAGCGTTRWSDTSRTGTEQLLVSSAIDIAVNKIDFSPMQDKRVYLETSAVKDITDNKYLMMSIRQHLAANGGVICDDKDRADYVVEVRAGAVGTDRDEMLIGIPSFNLPSMTGSPISGSIPEIPFIKRTKQRGIAKVAVFAYNKHTGRPVWASGNNQSEATTNNLWFAGTGPLTKGNIYESSTYAGHPIPSIPWPSRRKAKTFADQVAVFEEKPNERLLSEPSPLDGKENDRSTQLAETVPKYRVPPYNTPDGKTLPNPALTNSPYAEPYRPPTGVYQPNRDPGRPAVAPTDAPLR